MYMYALLFLTAHKMYLNILFIFWPHRLQFSPTKFSSSRMVAVGPGCWSIYSKILHVKRIPYAKYMNLLFHRSALYRRLPYIFFFIQMLNSLLLHLQTTSNKIFNCHLVLTVLKCWYDSIPWSKSHHKSCASLIMLGSDDGPNIAYFSPLSIKFLMSFKDVSF